MLKSCLAMLLLLTGLSLAGPLARPAAADDLSECYPDGGGPAIAACTRLIASGRMRGHPLAEAYRIRGHELSVNGEHDRAIADLDTAIRIDPSFPHAYTTRGLAYASKGDYARAIADCDRAIRMAPQMPRNYRDRGIVYRIKGDYEHAAADFNRAIRLDPTYASAYQHRAIVYRLEGDLDRSLSDYDQAIALLPYDAIFYRGRGFVHAQLGDYDRAIADYSRALRIDPGMSDVYTRRGLALEKKGDIARARESFNRALLVPLRYPGQDWPHKTARARLAVLDAPPPPKPPADKPTADRPTTGKPAAEKPTAEKPTPEKPTADKSPADKPAADNKPVAEKPTADKPAADNPSAEKPSSDTATAPSPAPSGPQGRRVALVIGNSDYKSSTRLPNTGNDADKIGALLKSAGFDVVDIRHDLTIAEMRRALSEFSVTTRDADIAVVFFAGHGMEVDGSNYLLPIDAKLEREFDVEDETVTLDRILRAVEPARRLRVVMLDACRVNPYLRTMQRTAATREIGRGLARIEPTVSDMLVAFAAKAGSVAQDGNGENSPFTMSLAHYITVPGLDIGMALRRVRDEVMKKTGGQQEPFIYGSLGGSEVPLAR